MEKKLDGNYTRMLRAILNKSQRQHPTKQQLYGYLLTIMKTLKIRRNRHVRHCWRSRDELISEVLLWTHATWTSKGGKSSSIIRRCSERGSEISVLIAQHHDDDDEIYIIWIGWVLWHIIHCGLFYAISSLYTYNKYL